MTDAPDQLRAIKKNMLQRIRVGAQIGVAVLLG